MSDTQSFESELDIHLGLFASEAVNHLRPGDYTPDTEFFKRRKAALLVAHEKATGEARKEELGDLLPFLNGSAHERAVRRMHALSGKEQQTEQYLCQSYFDDDGVLQDCTCGKCEVK